MWTIRHLSKQHERVVDRFQTIVEGHEKLLDKSAALLASGDALTYQSVQLSDYGRNAEYDSVVYDPSDEGEIARIAERSGEDELNGPERAAADALAGDADDFFAPGF